jgi:hypothetical protein
MLIWNIAKWNLSEGKITENVFGLIRINLEKSGIKIFDND